MRLFLSPYDLTPTYKNVSNRFSVKYYLNLVLVDEVEGLSTRSTRPSLHRLLLFRAYVCAFDLKVSSAPISVRVLVLNDPPARRTGVTSSSRRYTCTATSSDGRELWLGWPWGEGAAG